MPDVFISYSRKNKEFVQRVHAALAAQKRDIWVDWEDIPLTSDWWDEITTGIEAADTFIVVMTPDSMSSPICAMEIDHAIQQGKRLVPLVREPADEKATFEAMAARELSDNTRKALGERQILDLAKQNWNALSRHNWLYFKDDAEFDTGIQQLTSAIDTDLEHVKQHTRLLVRAREWENKGKDASYLLSGTDIADAEKWIAQNVAKQPSPLPLHAEYIGASRKAANRRQQLLLVGVSVALVVSIGLTILSFFLFRQSEASRDLAQANAAAAVSAQATAERRADESASILLAQRAQAVAPNDPFLAYALALNAASIPNPPAPAQELLDSVANIDAVRRFDGHEWGIISIIFTPDGQSALSVSWDGLLFRWDVATGQPIGTPDSGFFDFLAFSPDARYAALKTETNDIVIRDLETAETLYTLSGHESLIKAAAFSADGRYLISGSGFNYFDDDATTFNIIVWDLSTGQPVQTRDGLESPVYRVSLSPDGRYAAYVLAEVDYSETPNDMVLWEVATGEVLWTDNFPYLTDIRFSPDGSTIWINPNSGIEVREVTTGEVLSSSSETIATSNFAFDPWGETVLFGNVYSELSLWDALSPYEVNRYSGQATLITSVAISPDGNYALSGDQDGGLILWDLAAYRDRAFLDTRLPNTRAAISSDGQIVVWAHEIGGMGYITPNSTGFWTMGDITALALSPDGQSVVLGTANAALWYGEAAADYELTLLANVDSNVQSIAFSPNGETFLTGAANGSLILWDWFSGEELVRFVEQGSPMNIIAFSLDGITAASGADDGSVTVWNVSSGDVLRTLNGHRTAVTSAAFSPDGTYLLTGDNRGTLILWDAATGELLRTLNAPGIVTASVITFSPDRLTAAAGYGSGAILIWDVLNGTTLRAYLGHTSTVADIVFSADGVSIYSIANDGSSFQHYNESLPELINWFYANRQVPELTCEQRFQYNVEPYCDDDGSLPMSTPYPTLTPMPPNP